MISFIFYAIALAVVLAFVVSASRAAKTCSPLEVDASTPAPASNVVELTSPALRSCLRTTSSLPKSKSVHFVTLDSDTDSDLVSVRYYTLHHDKDLHPVSLHGNTPHIPGSKCGLVYPDGSIKMVKHLGTYHAPSSVSKRRPRCKNLRHFKQCFDCRRAPVERNTWLCGEVRPPLAVAIAKSSPVFQVPVASASRASNVSHPLLPLAFLLSTPIPIRSSIKRLTSSIHSTSSGPAPTLSNSPLPNPHSPKRGQSQASQDSGSSREGKARLHVCPSDNHILPLPLPLSDISPHLTYLTPHKLGPPAAPEKAQVSISSPYTPHTFIKIIESPQHHATTSALPRRPQIVL
ncbi:hypothetical protein DL98DRAFT_574800 [Cadophora sp. DSE1049]|nr:hypothetical protein DL98DRAFT_574800 [Cadophora sp. DSE1049]